MNCLKNIPMKNVIFWATDYGNAMKLLCLKKAWCLLLDTMYKEDLNHKVGSENKNSALEKFFKKIPG